MKDSHVVHGHNYKNTIEKRADEITRNFFEKQAKLNDDIEFNKFQQRVLDNPSNSMILAHAVGSGKTLSSIAKFEKMKENGNAKKALVVTPAGLRKNFGEDGVKKFTDSTYNIIGNSAELSKGEGFGPDKDSDYNIISYEMFRKNPQKYLKETGADTIIADEMHKLRNNDTQTLNSFLDTRDDYKNFIGLTGSIVNNKISDIYNLVNLSSKGEHQLGDSQKDFEEKHLKKSEALKYKNEKENRKPVIGFKDEKALKSDLSKYIDYASIDDVRPLSKIPRKELDIRKIPLSKEQAKYYKQIVRKDPNLEKLIKRKRLETLKDEEISKAFNSMLESRKLVNSVGSVIPGIPLEESAKISPKTKAILDDMEEHLSKTPDGQAILLTNMINGGADVLEAGLKNRGIEYGKFIGKGNKGVTEKSRQADVDDYNERKKKVMLISGAGAEGISLGDTTWEGVLDPHYNPERMNQMEARGIRAFGQSDRPEDERKVNVNRYMATMPKTLGVFKSQYKTPDEIIYEIAGNKDSQNQLLYNLLDEVNKEREKKKMSPFRRFLNRFSKKDNI